MSTSPTPTTTSPIRSKKVLVPKVWKRPHSTIYGKNVEFGSSLYSDKIGELNGRKFNSELPWTMRNSGASSTAGSTYNQGYLSNLFLTPSSSSSMFPNSSYNNNNNNNSSSSSRSSSGGGTVDSKALMAQCSNYVDLLDVTNPSRYSKRNINNKRYNKCMPTRIDFYEQYMDFSKEIDHLNNSSLLMNEPLLKRKVFDKFLDYDYELGLFLPNHDNYDNRDDRSLLMKNTLQQQQQQRFDNKMMSNEDHINTKSFVPLPIKTQQTNLLPKHKCQLMSSPYGQSADGRKLSLGSINPHSYRPSLPQKTTVAHASDGEEFEFQDKSSPFYTDRWAGKTIRHFDSDLYSNANLFKSMIL